MRSSDFAETLAFMVAIAAIALGLGYLADTADADWQDGIEYGCFKQAPWESESGSESAIEQPESASESAEVDSEGWFGPEWEDWASDEETGVTGDYSEWDSEWDSNGTCPVEWDNPSNGAYSPDYVRRMGVVEYGGEVFTWYSSRVLPGGGLTELNGNGRHVDDDGLVRDADGYIAVASPWGRDEIGTVVETPLGMGVVYDYCENDSYDLYTDW